MNKAILFAPTTGMGMPNCTNGAYAVFGSSTYYLYPMNISSITPYVAKTYNVSMFYVLNLTSGFYNLTTTAQIASANSIITDATIGFVCIVPNGNYTKIYEPLYLTATAGTVSTLDPFVNAVSVAFDTTSTVGTAKITILSIQGPRPPMCGNYQIFFGSTTIFMHNSTLTTLPAINTTFSSANMM